MHKFYRTEKCISTGTWAKRGLPRRSVGGRDQTKPHFKPNETEDEVENLGATQKGNDVNKIERRCRGRLSQIHSKKLDQLSTDFQKRKGHTAKKREDSNKHWFKVVNR